MTFSNCPKCGKQKPTDGWYVTYIPASANAKEQLEATCHRCLYSWNQSCAEQVQFDAALRAEREAREDLAARVAKLEAAQGAYRLAQRMDEEIVSQAKEWQHQREAMIFKANETPPSPAPTDAEVETWRLEFSDANYRFGGNEKKIATRLAAFALAREAKLREERDEAVREIGRLGRELGVAWAARDEALRKLSFYMEQRSEGHDAIEARTGGLSMDEVLDKYDALRARLDELEPLVAAVVETQSCTPDDYIRRCYSPAYAALVLHERKRARRAEASDGE